MEKLENKGAARLAFDMDGVLFNFAEKYAKEYNLKHPTEQVTVNEILQNWDVCKTTKYGDKLWKTPGFFATMKPYIEYFEVFRWAYANYDAFIVTTCPHHLCAEKTAAIKLYMPEFNDWDIIFCNRKDVLKFDYLFDDAPHNIEASRERCVAVSRPYNMETDAKFRVSSASEMKSFIKQNCKRKRSPINGKRGKITEKVLLDGFDGITHGLSYMSKIEGDTLFWAYRKDDGIHSPQTFNRDDAAHILVEMEPQGQALRIPLQQRASNHPKLELINSSLTAILTEH